jgi:hypothetical protein
MRRVVITGIGLITPLAANAPASWERLLAGKSGANKVEHVKVDDLPCQIACVVPRVDGRGGGAGDPHAFDPDKVMSAKEQRRIEDFILYAIAAADEAVADSGWKPESDEDKNRTGVLIGSGIGGIEAIGNTALQLERDGPRKISPFFIPSALINLASGQVSIRHGFRGPNHAVVTACATGAHAIGDASRLIQYGDADVMLAGGAEATVGRLAMAGFCALRASQAARQQQLTAIAWVQSPQYRRLTVEQIINEARHADGLQVDDHFFSHYSLYHFNELRARYNKPIFCSIQPFQARLVPPSGCDQLDVQCYTPQQFSYCVGLADRLNAVVSLATSNTLRYQPSLNGRTFNVFLWPHTDEYRR